MKTRVVGRVGHPDTQDARWVYDTQRRAYVEGPDVSEEWIVRTIDAEQAGLIQAVRHARERGWTWVRIAVILGTNAEEARQRFDGVDKELHSRGVMLPEDARTEPPALQPPQVKPPQHVEPLPVMAPEPPPQAAPKSAHDFSGLNKMTTDEIVKMAQELPSEAKLYDPYLRALREAIVVTLYKRDITQPQIAKIIGKSSQRVSQIIGGYYTRIEREWEQQRKGE